MTTVPLPDTPTLRVRLIYNTQNTLAASNRLYFSYSGAAPSGANCIAIADAIAAAWASDLAPVVNTNDSLNEVDVLDIATDSGLSGQWTGENGGTRSGGQIPIQVATNVEFGIARRYRGGKPRMFLPPGVEGDVTNGWEWDNTFVTAVNSAVEAFFASCAAISVGEVGTLAHTNLSYFKGFTNLANSSGRERAVATYRATALTDLITGYFCKQVLGSQKRRRTATSP